MRNKRKREDVFKVGDRVIVREGGTVYEVTEIDGHRCMIREEGTAPNGKPYAAQPSDTSLLSKAAPTVRPEVQAVVDLRGYDHLFINEEGVADFAQRFGLAGKIKPYRERANPADMRGLTLDGGAKSAVGMDAQVLAMRICQQLGVKFETKFGRGSQLRACCDALEQHYAAKGWVA